MSEAVGVQTNPELSDFYQQTGLAGRAGLGDHPAVVLVDMQAGWYDPERRLGADMDSSLAAAVELVTAARAANVAVVYVWSAWNAGAQDSGRWVDKIPALAELTLGTDGTEIHPAVAPQSGDPMILKKGPSGFFNTPLVEVLDELGVDTVLLAGASTSGCIRATSIDSMSNGFRTVLPAEAVGDRRPAPHEANLFDIDAKYGDVVPLRAVLEYLAALERDPEARRRAAEPRTPTAAGALSHFAAEPVG